jgi:hypothetical protein
MAQMIPSVDPDSIEHASERSTYIALRDGLSKKYTVFHSYPWLRWWRGDRDKALLEGEADFVIVHRTHGLLVLEVKGGEVENNGVQWYRVTKGGNKEIRNPFEQARHNMHAVNDIIRDRSSGKIYKTQYNHGYAVVFPDLDYTSRPPAYADRAIIICQRHLFNIADSINEAYAGWTDASKPLEPQQYQKLLDCLMPSFSFIKPIGPEVDAASSRILMLTETQSEAYVSLLSGSPRALVEGAAGSGKTELAIKRAIALSKEDKRTLFVCYNRHLADWLQGRLSADPIAGELDSKLLEIRNFHALASDLAKQAGIPWTSRHGEMGNEFWNSEVPEILNQAINVLEGQGKTVRYDAIVVDEAQDFQELWWYSLTEDLLAGEDAPLQVFLDPNQCLWGDVKRPEIDLPPPIVLPTNCRNTKRVATFAAHTIGMTANTFSMAPEGIPATIVSVASQRDQLSMVQQRIKRLLNFSKLGSKRIVLLGPAAKDRGSLEAIDEIEGTKLVTSVSEWTNGDGILVSTARSFKGLEADAVILYDVGTFGPLFTETDLYVACTRAIYVLEIVVHDEAMCARLRHVSEQKYEAAQGC